MPRYMFRWLGINVAVCKIIYFNSDKDIMYAVYKEIAQTANACIENAREEKEGCINAMMPHDAWSKQLWTARSQAISKLVKQAASLTRKLEISEYVNAFETERGGPRFHILVFKKFPDPFVRGAVNTNNLTVKRPRQTADTKSYASRQSVFITR